MILLNDKYYQTQNIRLKKYLYCCGYDYDVYIDDINKEEVFVFTKNEKFNSCLDFFINVRGK